MTKTRDKVREEVERNFAAISKEMDQHLALHINKYALMRHGEIVEFYATWEDAYKTGRRFYKDGIFSVQHITNTPVDLGYFSHAVHIG